MTDGKGVDVVFDPVGDKYCEPAVRALAWRGRYIVIGFAAGDIPKVPTNLLLLKEASLIGSAMRESQMNDIQGFLKERDQLVSYFEENKLNPLVTQLIPFDNAPRAFEILTNREAQGKVLLITKAYEDQFINRPKL